MIRAARNFFSLRWIEMRRRKTERERENSESTKGFFFFFFFKPVSSCFWKENPIQFCSFLWRRLMMMMSRQSTEVKRRERQRLFSERSVSLGDESEGRNCHHQLINLCSHTGQSTAGSWEKSFSVVEQRKFRLTFFPIASNNIKTKAIWTSSKSHTTFSDKERRRKRFSRRKRERESEIRCLQCCFEMFLLLNRCSMSIARWYRWFHWNHWRRCKISRMTD